MTCFSDHSEIDMRYSAIVKGQWTPKINALDGGFEYAKLQNIADSMHWQGIQKELVSHCLGSTNATMLRYMGTAAATRDLVAMADVFDGLGSLVNFWGMEYGSLLGTYLLKSKSCNHFVSLRGPKVLPVFPEVRLRAGDFPSLDSELTELGVASRQNYLGQPKGS